MDCRQTSTLDRACSNPEKRDCSHIDDFSELWSSEKPTKAHPESNSLESEILDLCTRLENVHATMAGTVRCHDLAYDHVAHDFNKLSRDYDNISAMIAEKQTENDELQNALRCKTSADVQTVEDVERLKCDVARTAERNKMLENKIHKEQMIVNSLGQQLECSEKSNARLSERADGLRCEVETDENAVAIKGAELRVLRDRNAGRRLVAKELTVERREREAALATFKECSPVMLAAAARSVDAERVELADACDAAADREARRARADDDFEQARADVDAQRCRAHAALQHLAEDRDRLADRLTETVAQTNEAKVDRRVLAATAKANTDRMACLYAETEQLRQRVHHGRSVVASQRAKIAAETKSIEDRQVANSRRLATADGEVKALEQISGKNEMKIKNARQELQEQCSMKACRC